MALDPVFHFALELHPNIRRPRFSGAACFLLGRRFAAPFQEKSCERDFEYQYPAVLKEGATKSAMPPPGTSVAIQ
jgi:hypothetical protein